MAEVTRKLADLSDGNRNQLESFLVEFDRSWNANSLDKHIAALPTHAAWRTAAILEMVKIDLERCWWRGRKTQIEDYLKRLPELGTRDTVSPELIVAEYEARMHAGFAPDLQDFASRFPRQAAAFQELLVAVKNDSRTAPSLASRPTVSQSHLTPSVAGARPTTPDLPEEFGRYRILQRLDGGGMGTVYLAHDTKLQRQVALKIPHFLTNDDPEMIKRFYHEAQLLASFQHPNICSVFDVGAIDGIHYLTMPYLAGQTLAHSISPTTPFDQVRAAEIVRKLARALHEAHKVGIVHRDLKPSNVMMTSTGEPVIIDFGLALRVNANLRSSQSGSFVGTPAYMSPEQVRSDPSARKPGCDVYGLGAILYEMLTGRRPFSGSVETVLAKIVREEPESIAKYRLDVSPALIEICTKMMAKSPNQRYETMADLEADLSAFLRVAAPEVSSNSRRPRLLYMLIGAAAAAILLGVILYVATNYGVVRIEVADSNVTVTIDGDDLTIQQLGEPIRLSVGPHRLQVVRNGEIVESRELLIRRGGNPAVTVTFSQVSVPVSPAPEPKSAIADKLNYFLALQKWNELKMERDLGETTDLKSVLGVAQMRLKEIRQSLFDHDDLPEDFRTCYVQLLRRNEAELTHWQTVLGNQLTAAVEGFKILTDPKVREDYNARNKVLKDDAVELDRIAAKHGARTDWQPLPRVTKVLRDSIAEKMGVQPGDFFFSYNGVKLYRKLPHALIEEAKSQGLHEVEVCFISSQKMLTQRVPGGTLVGVQIDTSSAEPPITVRLQSFVIATGFYVQLINLSQDTSMNQVTVQYKDADGQLYKWEQTVGSLKPTENILLDPSKVEFTVAPGQIVIVSVEGYEPREFSTSTLIQK